uniref:CCHC-type domain-containing protein n=1 Tax=Amphimedon queenslandica TaxID=400682 RepID=A0A1X7SZU3_AMPQE
MARVDRALLMKPSPPLSRGSTTARPPTVTAKLPKLTLKSFNGNLVAWTPFWDSFKSAVHDNSSLADIDKFSYLQSLLEGRARETIAGLPLTDANYSVPVDLLKKRFGSKERITAAHMEALMSLDAVSSDHHVYDLRRLYDKAESNIRSLAALGVAVESYGALLAPVFIRKLPSEMRLTIARKVPGMDERKRLIREQGRCFLCLRPGHISKHCRSSLKCTNCNGRHHASVCMRNSKPKVGQKPPTPSSSSPVQSELNPETLPFENSKTGATFYTSAGESTLLQVARVFAFNPNEHGNRMSLFVLLDSGSQCSYVTNSVCKRLGLPSLGTKSVSIVTFGSKREFCTECHVVKIGFELKGDAHMELKLLTVGHICEPLTYEAINLNKCDHN